MKTIELEPNIKNIISELAHQLQISESEVIQKAILDLLEKIRKKNRLMSYAGIIKDEVADYCGF